MPVLRYSAPARWLHWLIALTILVALVLALNIGDEPVNPHKVRMINYHKWAGLTVLWLVVLRVLWRLTHRPPELPPVTAAWQRRAAALAHLALYVLIVGVPMLGWYLSSAVGFPLAYLGVLPLPNLIEKNKPAALLLHEVHEVFAWALAVIAVLHAAAALKHHFVDHDDVLRRML
jgi:cytochrome b561